MLSVSIRSKLATLLSNSGVRLTPIREQIYEAINGHEEALSMMDIELLLDTVDKSTISRSLHIFLEVGAVHKIDDGTGVYKFAVSPFDIEEIQPHAHFYCDKCARTYCIDEIALPSAINLPEGFRYKSLNLVFKGVCPNCC